MQSPLKIFVSWHHNIVYNKHQIQTLCKFEIIYHLKYRQRDENWEKHYSRVAR